jgi:hypothetical protein
MNWSGDFTPTVASACSVFSSSHPVAEWSCGIARMKDRYALTACDIHEQAIAFQAGVLGVEAILSRTDPEALILAGDFDVASHCRSFRMLLLVHGADRGEACRAPWLTMVC